MKREPLPLIACSLDGAAFADRAAEIRELFGGALRSRETIDRGIRFVFARGTAEQIRGLVAKEHECCPFFEFAIEESDAAVTLDVRGPPEARPLIEAFGS